MGQENSFDIPVLLIVYKRLDTVVEVLAKIKALKPTKFYVAGDGPQRHKSEEIAKCSAVKEYIIANIDWPCEFHTNFREENIGCRKSVEDAIDWVMNREGYGIILEDDCLPNDDFFVFCKELLQQYKDDERVMLISGTNLVSDIQTNSPYSYCFSKNTATWGWATWKRAWDKYDHTMPEYHTLKQSGALRSSFDRWFMYWQRLTEFETVINGSRNIWDYVWRYNVLTHSGLTIIPSKNLIKNIGFSDDATHTSKADTYSVRETEKMQFPLVHPPYMMPDKRMDEQYENRFYRRPILHAGVRLTLFLGIFAQVKMITGSIRKILGK
jgi:hypothetical protein